MTRIITRNKPIIIIFAILMIICFSIGLFSVANNAAAANDPIWDSEELVVAHLTDTHYYPIRYTYNGESQEFFDYVHEQFHKMWFESEAAFWDSLRRIKEMKPDYLVVTGDIAQDGERQSHIDVANGLRRLQNEMRDIEGMEHFQVFVTFGNHDLYNPKVYDFSDGTKQLTDFISRKEASLIYSSLGYPNVVNQEDIDAIYSEDEYSGTNSSLGFVNSTLADGIDISWQYDDSKEDYQEGELTYIAKTNKGYTFASIDVVESNEEEGHVLGATLTKDTQNFLNSNKKHTDFCIGLAHHSIVPHFTKQRETLSGFIINDWINGADFLADYGIRYIFTGHMHANDIAHHISFNNNQITDIETAANHSLESAIRKATIKSGTLGEEKVQNLYIENNYLVELDISDAIDDNYITSEYIEYNGLGQYVDWENKKITDYSNYARKRMYDNTINNVVTAYLDPSIMDMLKNMLYNMLPDSISILDLKKIKDNIGPLLDQLILQINQKSLADYEYSGDNAVYKESKLFGFAEELVNRALDIEVAPNTKVFDFVMYSYLGHIYGNEADSIEAMPENIQQGFEFMRSGQFVEELFDVLLDKENGLYYLIKNILETQFDFSSITELEPFINSIQALFDGFDDLSLSNLILGEFLASVMDSGITKSFGLDFSLEGKDVVEFLDDTIEDYLTDSVYVGLGEIASDILISFGTDASFDGNSQKTLILFSNNDEYTYISTEKEDIATLANGKMPSKITVTFGEDTSTTKNFTWFTDMRVTDGVVQYMEKSQGSFDATKATTVTGTTEIYGYTVGLIDLGIFAQLGYTEAARHTTKLTNLKPGVEYLYRVGSSAFGYFSEVFTFKTAPSAEDAPFEILLISDPQGFTNTSYEKIGEVLDKAQTVFDNGYDFIVNTGDLVENSKNVTQYDYYLNTLRKYMANTTQVIAVGNHGKYSFELEEDYNVSSDQVVTDEYNFMLMHFNFDIPEQDTKTGAYYSYDYSGVHFTVLNTNDIDKNNQLSQTQIDWLKEDLSNTTKAHKVVFMHKSLYSAGAHSYDKEIINMRSQLGPIFEEKGVRIVLSGHDHTYNETYYLDADGEIVRGVNNKTDKVGKKGTLFVNLGTVGGKFYNYVENEEVPVFRGEKLHNPTLSNPTFGKLVFDGKDLYYQGYEYDYDTQKVSKIKASLTTLDIILIVVGSVVGAAGIAVGVFFIIKGQKAKKLKLTGADNAQADMNQEITDAKAIAEPLAAEDEKE